MSIKKIRSIGERIRKAEEAMGKALEIEYPVGTTVRFYIMHGQVIPSIGDVISHPGGRWALVRMRLHSRTKHVRDVPAQNIF